MNIVFLTNQGILCLSSGRFKDAATAFHCALEALDPDQDYSNIRSRLVQTGHSTTFGSTPAVSTNPTHKLLLYTGAFRFYRVPSRENTTHHHEAQDHHETQDQTDRIAAVLLYNLALTYHIQALVGSQESNGNNVYCKLRKAFAVYNMANRAIGTADDEERSENKLLADKTVALAAHNNQAQISFYFLDKKSCKKSLESVWVLLRDHFNSEFQDDDDQDYHQPGNQYRIFYSNVVHFHTSTQKLFTFQQTTQRPNTAPCA